MAVGIRHADHLAPLYLQKLALTSPTSSGRSVGIVRSRTQATEFSFLYPLKERCLYRTALTQRWDKAFCKSIATVWMNWRVVASFTPLSVYPRERSFGTHWIWGRVDPRAYGEESNFLLLHGIEPQFLSRCYTDWTIRALPAHNVCHKERSYEIRFSNGFRTFDPLRSWQYTSQLYFHWDRLC
jgi:hypothetical protein